MGVPALSFEFSTGIPLTPAVLTIQTSMLPKSIVIFVSFSKKGLTRPPPPIRGETTQAHRLVQISEVRQYGVKVKH